MSVSSEVNGFESSEVIRFEPSGYEYGPILNGIEVLNNKQLAAEKVNSTAQNTIQKSNGDMVLTPLREFIYAVVIDITGGVTRQTFTIINDVITLASKVHATILPVIACVAIPISLLVSGIGCLVTGLAWTLPDSCDDLAKAEWELASDPQAIKLKAPEESLMIPDEAEENESKLTIKKLELAGTVTEAKEAVEIARLGVVNQYFYTQMGAFQIAAAGVAFAGPEVAHVFHYAPALTGHAASAATATTAIALGAVYLARGAFMLYQSGKSYKKVDKFENELKDKKTLNKVLDFMKESEKLGSSYLNRRVNESCLIEKESDRLTLRYTATGIERIIKGEKTTTTEYANSDEKRIYLERVSKGIYTEKLKHKVRMTIAAAMIIGGVLTIVLAAISGVGLAAIGISLAAAIFFFLMESVYSTYDSSFVFQKLRDFFYERSNESAWVNGLKVGFDIDYSAYEGPNQPAWLHSEGDIDFSSVDESPKELGKINLLNHFFKPQKSELNKPNPEDDKSSDFESLFPKFPEPGLDELGLNNGLEYDDDTNTPFSPELRFVESD